MIVYDSTKHLDIIFRVWGSVFPKAFKFSAPATIAAVILKLLFTHVYGTTDLTESVGSNVGLAGYGGFTAVLGFLLVFRNSQAYNRYWEGKTLIHQMRSEWFEACANLFAFTTLSKNPKAQVQQFRHTLVRLFSLMHSCALQEIAVMHEEEFNLIDARGLDHESRDYLLQYQADGSSKAHLTFQWVLNIIVNNMDTGLLPVPAPILTRVFQEISNGKLAAENALKITDTQFPFPYAQTAVVLLMMHSVLTPIVVCMYTGSWVVSALLTFVAVFVFWCIHFIAIEIEEPFGDDVNDLPLYDLQTEMNHSLIQLLDDKATCKVPTLADEAQMEVGRLLNDNTCWQSLNQSYALTRSKRHVSREMTRSKSLKVSFPAAEKPDRSLASALKRVSISLKLSHSGGLSPSDGSKGTENLSMVDVSDKIDDDVEPGKPTSTIRSAGSAAKEHSAPRPPQGQMPMLQTGSLAPGAIDDSEHSTPLGRNGRETGDDASSSLGAGTGFPRWQSNPSTSYSRRFDEHARDKKVTRHHWM